MYVYLCLLECRADEQKTVATSCMLVCGGRLGTNIRVFLLLLVYNVLVSGRFINSPARPSSLYVLKSHTTTASKRILQTCGARRAYTLSILLIPTFAHTPLRVCRSIRIQVHRLPIHAHPCEIHADGRKERIIYGMTLLKLSAEKSVLFHKHLDDLHALFATVCEVKF